VLRTALYDMHVELGARLVEFAGWEMPLLYTGIVEEHLHTRAVCSLFDVSHMGRLKLTGVGSQALLQRVCTRNVGDQAVGQSRYSHMCKETGGILDDVIVSRYPSHWLVVCNASNREKILAWLRRHAEGTDVQVEDQTLQTAMVALQGPKTLDIAARLLAGLPLPLADLKRYHFLSGNYAGFEFTVFRSGYTGEDGLEVILPATAAGLAWQFMRGAEDRPPDATEATVKPAGLGARDTLRLEAAMPLYGHELTEEVDSLSAGQGWCVDLSKVFIGAEAMRRIKERGFKRKLVGLELEGKRTARQHYAVLAGGKPVGEVTGGTFSPTLNKSIAMAYVPPEHAQPGTRLAVDIKGKPIDAVVVPLPFYKRPKPAARIS